MAMDLVVALGVVAAVVAAGVASSRVRRRWRGEPPEHRSDPREVPRIERIRQVAQSMARWRWALHVPYCLIVVRIRNLRTPGMRLMRTRRADARTGGPVTVRSAIVSYAVSTAWSELGRRLYRGADARDRERQTQVQAEVQEIQRRHAGDREAMERAIAECYSERSYNCMRPAVRRLPLAMLPLLPILWTERRQTAADWLAGIVVVSDDS